MPKATRPSSPPQVEAALNHVGEIAGRAFGDARRPLLVSVRSGSRASMPGMMDTVLNLGLNDATVEALAADARDPRFAYDSYRRFIQMYSSIVLGIGASSLRGDDRGFQRGQGADARHRSLGRGLAGDDPRLQGEDRGAAWQAFPQAPREQLWGAIGAVFGSWNNPRAKIYGSCTISPKAGARPSTSRRWCSAIWARPPRRALPSRAIPRRARKSSMASS